MAPRKAALSKKEDIEAVPITEPVEIETVDVAEPPKVEIKTEPAPVVKTEPTEDEQVLALKKQLEDLKKVDTSRAAEMARLQSEAQRARTEYAERVRVAQEGTEQAQYDAILNAIGAATAEGDSAERDAAAALAANNVAKLIESQRRIARAESRLERLEEGKSAFEARRDAVKSAPPPVVDQFEASISKVPEQARGWLRTHPEYVTDTRKNAKIQALHWDAVEAGHTAFSTPYFEYIETELGLRQKPAETAEDDDEPTPPPRKDPVVSAPVSRSSQSLSDGKKTGSSTTVELSPEEREMAKLSGVDERVYAQNKLRLQALKKQGHYTN
jgi:hypothetical protein